MEKYFIIRNNEDGVTYVNCVTKEELLKRLNENYYSENTVFLDEMPNDSDTEEWGGKVLIVKGSIASPFEKTQYSID
jgi:hypothetical protein